MAYTDATNRAVQKYSKKAYDTFVVRVKKGEHEPLKAYASSKGMSLNGYINKLIKEDMKKDCQE